MGAVAPRCGFICISLMIGNTGQSLLWSFADDHRKEFSFSSLDSSVSG